MRKQVIVIGLGQFGMALSRTLSERGVEVLAVDVNEERVRLASAFVVEAACFDATDEQALMRAAPERREVCVNAIGDDAKDASIICTALLRQMGAPYIVGRASDDLHARILRLVGAHHVVNPEREFGERFASRIVHQGIIAEMPLGEDLVITELTAPSVFVGRSLDKLELPRRFGLQVVAIRRGGSANVLIPEPKETLVADDVLVIVSKQGAVGRLLERI
ncbi:MAG: TrkA family potassium uptake protein [Deltaproteobacteria bacterium]|nr:TrkA family potassium uptake protein [Deltaproteobacteria bacterium]